MNNNQKMYAKEIFDQQIHNCYNSETKYTQYTRLW